MKQGGPLKSTKCLVPKTALKTNKSLSPGSTTLKKSRINPVSKKMSGILAEYIDIKLFKVKNESSECRGCGGPQASPNSHIIPRSKREDLIAILENITWHCRKCHDIWDGSNWDEKKKMHDFDFNMNYIQGTDPAYYRLLMTKANKK